MPDTNEKMKFRYNNKEQRNIKMNTFLTMGFAVLYLEMAAYLILADDMGQRRKGRNHCKMRYHCGCDHSKCHLF